MKIEFLSIEWTWQWANFLLMSLVLKLIIGAKCQIERCKKFACQCYDAGFFFLKEANSSFKGYLL